jgi:hypothetical protein
MGIVGRDPATPRAHAGVGLTAALCAKPTIDGQSRTGRRGSPTMGTTRSSAPILLPGLLLVIVSLLTAGCGGSEGELAPVQGTVTLDGEPLAGAKVEFDLKPEEITYGKSEGSTSYGKTDAQGRYTLEHTHEQEGALIGKHVVRITTREMTVDESGKEVLVPERLPPRYNLNSELTAEVEPGSNTIDFDLTLEPSAKAQP